jgi:hypothetical protein
MEVNLNIDNDPDAEIIKTLLETGYNGQCKADVFGFETEEGSTLSYQSKYSKRLIREQFVKTYFEKILEEDGNTAAKIEFLKILKEIIEGE